MGMYTEVFARATLKKDVPQEVVDALKVMASGCDEEPVAVLPEHELFQCSRWDLLGRCSSAYFPNTAKSVVATDWYSKQWTFVLHANLKNYGGEIEKFFDWIDPYVESLEGEFLGYELYEDVDPNTGPILYYKK
jgi:hypothetical protein